MEKFAHRENVLLAHVGSGTQIFSENSPKTPYRNSEDLDFKDVFGGPPRCYSMQEVRVRYSLGETVESEEERVSSPWIVLKEKPVFGEESMARSRHTGNDFFNDIFKGAECYISPRRTDSDRDSIFGSSPGSRIMSPARPLPPKVESFRTSLLAQFSLPDKLTKAMELPSFTSRNQSHCEMDGITNGLNSPCSPSTASLSRFSSQTKWDQDEIRNDVHHTVYRQSPLSHGASFSSEDSLSTVTYNQKDSVQNLKKDTKIVEPPQTCNQFHFSIYKWPERSVPMIMPLVSVNNLKSKDTSRIDKWASSNGRDENESTKIKSMVTYQGFSENKDPKSLEMEPEKRVSRSEDVKELKNYVEKAFDSIPESKSQSNSKSAVVFDGAVKSIKAEVKSLDEIDISEKTKKEVPLKMEGSLDSKAKTTRAVLNDAIEQQGNVTKMKENKTRNSKVGDTNVNASKKFKKNEETGVHSNRENVCITSSMNKSQVKGKIKEFVQIFNQEADTKPDVQIRSQSYRWKAVSIDQTNNHEVSLDVAKIKEQMNLQTVDKRLDVSLKVDKNLNKYGVKQYFQTKTPDHVSTEPKCAFSSVSRTKDSKVSEENADDPFEDNFLVQELSNDHENVTQNGKDSDYTKASDAKVQQWSRGKKGNIRSLLSTLQYVLWTGSGWKPVPLVDLIEENSVKRAYQKALLYLHPDKLQQKGAASHQKYIAEKVFEILQEAWHHFNSLSHL